MSKICPYCNAQMPEEANLCLNCLNDYGSNVATAQTNKKQNIINKIFTKSDALMRKINTLSRKKKIIFSAASLCFVVFICLIAYLLSPVEEPVPLAINDTQFSDNADKNSSGNNISHAEAILNKIFGDEEGSNNSANNDKNNSSSIPNKDNKTSKNNTTTSDKGASVNSTPTTKPSNNNSTTSNSNSTTGSNSSSSTDSSSGANNSNDINYTPVLNYDDWEYKIESGELYITKYKGNDKHVMVPDQFDSTNVHSIEANTFLNNSTVETVTFRDSEKYHELWIDKDVFKNCSSLKKISFPNNTDLGFYYQFAVNCPKLNDIYINHWQGKFVEGAFYWKANGRTWQLINYCEGCTNDTLNVPDWVSSVLLAANNLSNCKYLKTINLPQDCTPPDSQSYSCPFKYLEEINITEDDGSQYYFTYKGVLFSRSGVGNYKINLDLYPGAKKDKSFTFPEYCRIDLPASGLDLNLETIYIPKSSDLDDFMLKNFKSYFKNLKTVKLEKGHENVSKYKTYLAWDCSVEEY